MARTILVTGGGASGKSRWAVSQFAACDNVLYICPKELDSDTKNRIEYSNKKNLVEWEIHENVTSEPSSLCDKHKFTVFDSLDLYVDVVIEEMCPNIEDLDWEMEKAIEKRIIEDIMNLHTEARLIEGDVVIITLETGFSNIPEDPFLLAKRNILGMINQRIANESTDVYLSASGIQFRIK